MTTSYTRFALALLLSLLSLSAQAAPGFIPYSGRLTDGAVAPSDTTEVNLRVRLYDCCGPAAHACVAAGGNACEADTVDSGLWYEELHVDVRVVRGYFSLRIGARTVPGLPSELPERMWIELEQESAAGNKKLPRQEIGALPFAMQAESLSGLRAVTEPTELAVSPNGDDATGNANGNPFLTIQGALDSLPKLLLATVVIRLSPGAAKGRTSIGGFFGNGAIRIVGSEEDSLDISEGYIIEPDDSGAVGISVTGCRVPVLLRGFKIERGTGSNGTGVHVTDSSSVRIWHVRINGFKGSSGIKYAGIKATHSSVNGWTLQLDNNDRAVWAEGAQASVDIEGLRGEGNGTAFYADHGGTVSANSVPGASKQAGCYKGIVLGTGGFLCP